MVLRTKEGSGVQAGFSDIELEMIDHPDQSNATEINQKKAVATASGSSNVLDDASKELLSNAIDDAQALVNQAYSLLNRAQEQLDLADNATDNADSAAVESRWSARDSLGNLTEKENELQSIEGDYEYELRHRSRMEDDFEHMNDGDDGFADLKSEIDLSYDKVNEIGRSFESAQESVILQRQAFESIDRQSDYHDRLLNDAISIQDKAADLRNAAQDGVILANNNLVEMQNNAEAAAQSNDADVKASGLANDAAALTSIAKAGVAEEIFRNAIDPTDVIDKPAESRKNDELESIINQDNDDKNSLPMDNVDDSITESSLPSSDATNNTYQSELSHAKGLTDKYPLSTINHPDALAAFAPISNNNDLNKLIQGSVLKHQLETGMSVISLKTDDHDAIDTINKHLDSMDIADRFDADGNMHIGDSGINEAKASHQSISDSVQASIMAESENFKDDHIKVLNNVNESALDNISVKDYINEHEMKDDQSIGNNEDLINNLDDANTNKETAIKLMEEQAKLQPNQPMGAIASLASLVALPLAMTRDLAVAGASKAKEIALKDRINRLDDKAKAVIEAQNEMAKNVGWNNFVTQQNELAASMRLLPEDLIDKMNHIKDLPEHEQVQIQALKDSWDELSKEGTPSKEALDKYTQAFNDYENSISEGSAIAMEMQDAASLKDIQDVHIKSMKSFSEKANIPIADADGDPADKAEKMRQLTDGMQKMIEGITQAFNQMFKAPAAS